MPRRQLTALILGSALITLDGTATTIALPIIGRDLSAPILRLQWIRSLPQARLDLFFELISIELGERPSTRGFATVRVGRREFDHGAGRPDGVARSTAILIGLQVRVEAVEEFWKSVGGQFDFDIVPTPPIIVCDASDDLGFDSSHGSTSWVERHSMRARRILYRAPNLSRASAIPR